MAPAERLAGPVWGHFGVSAADVEFRGVTHLRSGTELYYGSGASSARGLDRIRSYERVVVGDPVAPPELARRLASMNR